MEPVSFCALSDRLFSNFQLFERIRKECPESCKKVKPIIGDLVLEGLGLNPEDLGKLITEVSIVFHFAATLRLESNVKDAVMQNTVGTQTLLDICLKMKKLTVIISFKNLRRQYKFEQFAYTMFQAFMHLSTAFCHVDVDVLEEKMYPPLKDPYEIMDLVRKTDYKTMEKMEKRYFMLMLFIALDA